MAGLTLLLALALALIHLLAGHLRFLDTIPRSRWLSIAGGASVAYVFLHLLPELGQGQQALAETDLPAVIRLIEVHAYAVALVGLVLFYGLERFALASRRKGEHSGHAADAPGIFRVHMASYAVYNALIGYLLLHREEQTVQSLVLFFIAMGLHFVINDYGLRFHFAHRYLRRGRWILSAAVLAGWALGLAWEVSEAAIAVLFAFLAGGVILNVLKEELPESRESRFSAFLLGAALYSTLIFAL